MPFYDFVCDVDDWTETVHRAMNDAGDPLECALCLSPMHRVYSDFQKIIHYDPKDYVQHAYDGGELPGGMNQRQVRAIVDSEVRTRRGVVGNSGKYGRIKHGGTR